jgi:hypothetical protein
MAENESGERAFKVDGNAVQLRETFVLRDAAGPEVAEIQERKLSVRDSMKSSAPPGTRPFTRHWSVCGIVSRSMWTGGADMSAQGNLVDHSTRSSATRTRSRRCRRNGSGSARRMVSRSSPAKTTPSSQREAPLDRRIFGLPGPPAQQHQAPTSLAPGAIAIRKWALSNDLCRGRRAVVGVAGR